MRRGIAVGALLVVLCALGSSPAEARVAFEAGGPSCVVRSAVRAGSERSANLVIETADGSSESFCIAFSAKEEAQGFSGADLLRRSGLPIVFGGTASDASVCRIGTEGCSDAGQCFCACANATSRACRFWGYYTLSAGVWKFSSVGASRRMVHNGDVDGWRYANHQGGKSFPHSSAKPCANGVTHSIRGARHVSRVSAHRGSAMMGLVVAGVAVAGFAIGIGRSARRRGRTA